MKPLYILFFVMLLGSCSKDESQFIKENIAFPELSKSANEVLSMQTIGEMKKSFSLLESTDKEAIWKIKYLSILNEKNSILNKYQKDIVEKLYNFLTKNGYEKIKNNPIIGQEFLNQNIKYFEKYFSKEQLYMLIELPYYNNEFSITKSLDYLSLLRSNEMKIKSFNLVPNDETLPAPDCGCYYSLSCWGLANYCETGKNGCSKISECGLFGTSNCTGMCTY